MTSNIGSGYLTESIRQDGSIGQAVKDQVREELNKYFRPEFINRHILRHVDTHDVPLIVEEGLRQSFRQLGLADAGW